MAWRFKVSKYKNTTPKLPKKEDVIQDIPVGNPGHSCGNHIKASCVYMVFNTDSANGGSLGYLPLNTKGRVGSELTYIQGHGDFVADFDFSPFDDYMLATGAQDNSLKVWLLPQESERENVSEAALVLPSQNRRIENVLWHPTADGVLAASTDTCVKVFDVVNAAEKCAVSDHGDQVQNMSWRTSGALMSTTCRDKQMRILDLRANQVVQKVPGHQSVKDTRIQWLGDTDYIVSTGFAAGQDREIKLWDVRNLQSSLKTLGAQGSTGALMCFFDEDTSMVFLAGKSDTSIRFLEVTEKTPYLTEGMVDRTEQIKGAALVPKRAMELMSGEVDRLLLLVKQSILSVPYVVPRKSYRDFHADLYPDTAGGEPALTASQWFSGQDGQVTKVPLVPNKPLIRHDRRGALLGLSSEGVTKSAGSSNETASPSAEIPDKVKPLPLTTKPVISQSKPSPPPSGASQTNNPTSNSTKPAGVKSDSPVTTPPASNNESTEPPGEPVQPAKVFKGIRQSKYRYIVGKTLHPSLHITNIRNLCKTIPGDSDLFVANTKRCAVPLEGAGGIIAVLELSKPGRLGDTADELPTIQNGSKMCDFVWDPFDDCRLVVGCDNARINVWRVPSEGFPIGPSQTEPEFYMRGHMEKIYFVRFHPLVKDILMSSSYDMTVRMWNLDTRSEVMQLQGQQDQVFCLAWSPCSKLCATVCKDGLIRMYEPRASPDPVKEGPGPDGSRGARVTWALDARFLIVSGFQKSGEQQVGVYDAETLQRLSAIEFFKSPSVLIPFYDADSSTVYFSCRGERTVHNYDVSEEHPHLFGNSDISLTSLHQGLSFLPRNALNVVKVEVARAWRLTNNSIEPVSFTVPRVRTEYFQDDLYPDTLVTWEPALTAAEWLGGQDTNPRRVSLCPAGMEPVSQAPVEAPKPKKFESFNPDTFKSDEQKKDELLTAMVGKLELSTDPLPQDLAEGVEDDEW
ncbi:hypothetical protein BaRGS_00012379, partial [Batillaria attramentaria]